MELKFVPKKNQKFDIGRTINPFKCGTSEVGCSPEKCQKCQLRGYYLNECKNYAPIMVQKRYSVREWYEENRGEDKGWISPLGIILSYDALNDFIDNCIGNFPSGTYWKPDYVYRNGQRVGDRIDGLTLVSRYRNRSERFNSYYNSYNNNNIDGYVERIRIYMDNGVSTSIGMEDDRQNFIERYICELDGPTDQQYNFAKSSIASKLVELRELALRRDK